MNLIITRHRGAVDWLRARGITGTVIEHATGTEGRSGDTVYGILPADYMDRFLRRGMPVFFIALPNIPLDKRKGDLSEAEMNEAGACLFRIRSIELEAVDTP
jgi:CRISPR-associated protein Csx16